MESSRTCIRVYSLAGRPMGGSVPAEDVGISTSYPRPPTRAPRFPRPSRPPLHAGRRSWGPDSSGAPQTRLMEVTQGHGGRIGRIGLLRHPLDPVRPNHRHANPFLLRVADPGDGHLHLQGRVLLNRYPGLRRDQQDDAGGPGHGQRAGLVPAPHHRLHGNGLGTVRSDRVPHRLRQAAEAVRLRQAGRGADGVRPEHPGPAPGLRHRRQARSGQAGIHPEHTWLEHVFRLGSQRWPSKHLPYPTSAMTSSGMSKFAYTFWTSSSSSSASSSARTCRAWAPSTGTWVCGTIVSSAESMGMPDASITSRTLRRAVASVVISHVLPASATSSAPASSAISRSFSSSIAGDFSICTTPLRVNIHPVLPGSPRLPPFLVNA